MTLGGTDGALSEAQDAGFASNGYGTHSPGGFSLLSVAIVEIVVTAIFVLIVLGTTSTEGVPSGLGPTLGTAVVQGDWALGQAWAFFVFPAIGAVVAGLLWIVLGEPHASDRGEL